MKEKNILKEIWDEAAPISLGERGINLVGTGIGAYIASEAYPLTSTIMSSNYSSSGLWVLTGAFAIAGTALAAGGIASAVTGRDLLGLSPKPEPSKDTPKVNLEKPDNDLK